MAPDPTLTLTLFYTCEACQVRDRPLIVPVRDKGMDVVVWMNDVVRRVRDDHSFHNPRCRETTLTNLKIPVTGRPWVGGPILQ